MQSVKRHTAMCNKQKTKQNKKYKKGQIEIKEGRMKLEGSYIIT